MSISTTSKGDAFKSRMARLLQDMLDNERLPVNSKFSKLFQKKGYFSPKRQGNIIIDISIECCLPGENAPSLYLMVECKDYSKPIPVNDVEEFFSKVEQIAGLNAKAIFIATNALQEGALNFAKSSGMRVMRVYANDRIEVLSFRKEATKANTGTREYINATIGLLATNHMMRSSAFIGIGPGKTYHSLISLITDAITSEE